MIWLNWIEHRTVDPEVTGSIPVITANWDDGVMANISVLHAEDSGSIPGRSIFGLGIRC